MGEMGERVRGNAMERELSVSEFMEEHWDGVYEYRYAMVKEAAFDLYLWALRTDNDDAMKFYKQMLRLYRTYDSKFERETNSGE